MAIEVQYATPLTDVRKTAVMLRAGVADYASIMVSLGTVMQVTKTRAPTAAEYITEMHKQFRIEKEKADSEKKPKKKPDDEDNSHKTAPGEVGAFFKKCYGCGKTGHKKSDCTNKEGGGYKGKKGNPNNNQGNCNHCGFKGHKEAECWRNTPN